MPTKRDRVYFPVTPETLQMLEEWADSETRTIPNLCEREMSRLAERWKAAQSSPETADALATLEAFLDYREQDIEAAISALAKIRQNLSD